jgi:hypothetical protein
MSVPTEERGPDSPADQGGGGDRLDSWKEIASHLGRDIRTVQRWERREGLPVHRQQHDKLGSVYASQHEIDAWRAARSHRLNAPAGEAGNGPHATATSAPDFADDAPVATDGASARLDLRRLGRFTPTALAAAFATALAGWLIIRSGTTVGGAPPEIR